MVSTPAIEIHYADEWAALYVDGVLVTVGDACVAEEKALSMLGVRRVHDAAFMRGQSRRDGVAMTLAQADAYRQQREHRETEAVRLRVQAKELLAQAETLMAPAEEER
jgi:hypothetical protein